jgi:ATP phosphoribosyltransferase regulatory subunit HisZ
MKKLIHFLQTGRLVNIANFSVHTISSVVKKFLRKLPDGVFGVEAEKQLFDVLLSSGESPDLKFKQEEVRRYVPILQLNQFRISFSVSIPIGL